VDVVDTTGAGDIFHAGFIFGLLHNRELGRTLDFACAAAALNCTATGARGGIRPVEAIEALMAGDLRCESAALFSDGTGRGPIPHDPLYAQ
jgi:sulfofructose kinase